MEITQITQLPPLKAVRKYCLDCTYNQINEIKLCPSIKCEFYPFRFGRKPLTNVNFDQKTPSSYGLIDESKRADKLPFTIKLIKKHCVENCGEDTKKDVINCEFPECSIFAYRLGKNPKKKRKKEVEER